ncbi:MAG: peptidyl-prolyl cis-trans isomerase [Pseudomonadota bacterium]
MKKSNPVMWVLMGLLIVALGGFGASNFGGSIRSIGTVGNVDIDVQDYANGLRQALQAETQRRGEPVSFARAQDDGLDEQVLAQLIAEAAFDAEAQELGLSVGDANLRDEILSMPQFQSINGEFDRDVYTFGLENAGLTEGQFEEDVRADTARSILQAAVIAGISAPQAYSDTVTEYLGERRDVSWSLLDRSDITTGLPVATDADLQAFHTDNAEDFTIPEAKRLTYAWVNPTMLLDSVEVDEDALREAYDDAFDEFNLPERRLVERLVFGTDADGAAAKARIDAGEVTFEDVVTERGLELPDIDLGDLDRDALGENAEAIFAADVGGVVGPLPSSLGPALFRVNAILSAQETSFDEAKPILREELAADRARRVVNQMIDSVDDLLAGGATVEDVAQETDLELGTIDWFPGVTDDIARYGEFRTAAAAITENDFPEVMDLEDGGIFAMRLDEIVPPTLQPFDEVRGAVEAAWAADSVVSTLRETAEPLIERLNNGEGFEDVGLPIDGAQALTRRSLGSDTPPEFIDIVFGMEAGDVRLIDGEGRLYVLKLDEVSPPDPEDGDLAQLRQILENQAAAGLSQDIFAIVADEFRNRAGVDLDFQAINAVHANFN